MQILNIHRFVVGGAKNNNGYITKFIPQSIILNSDFLSVAWLMTALSFGTDDIIAQSGVTIAAPDASFTPSNAVYTNQTVTYNFVSSTTLDAYLQIKAETFSVSESTTSTQVPNLSCSFSGSTSIVFSLNSYSGGIVPSFVSIDSATGVLTIVAPSVSSSTDFSFYITSTISGMSGPVQKIINLTVNKCTVGNCQICTIIDSSICATCNPGYILNLGNWNLLTTQSAQNNTQSAQQEIKMSETAKLLRTINQVVMVAVVLISVGFSLTNLSSMTILWSVINQMQILFLLFLTGAFIPKDIEGIITGLDICLNPFSYLQLKLNLNHNFVSNYFNFGLENKNLEKFEIKSDSTIVNMTSFFLSIIIMWILHFWIFLIQKLLPKKCKSNCWSNLLSGIHWFLQKLMVLFTFSLYIRIIMETCQFILIAWVSEIYQFDFDGIKRKISIIIAFFILIAWIAIIVITILFALSKNADKFSESPEKRSKFAHLFDGVSPNKKSRLFVWLLQIRRAVFIILLIIVGPKSLIIVISLLVGLQLIYLVLLGSIRPYKMTVWNFIEITNEFYFLVMLAFLIKYNTAADWKEIPTTVYTWLISSNSWLCLLINIGK